MKTTTRRCYLCKETKGMHEFGNNPTKTGGRGYSCKKCRRDFDYKRRYGVTAAYVDLISLSQDGCCGICGRKPRKLHVDHNHSSGAVRGLLCSDCNTGLGLFKEDPAILNKAIEYLSEHARVAHTTS